MRFALAAIHKISESFATESTGDFCERQAQFKSLICCNETPMYQNVYLLLSS